MKKLFVVSMLVTLFAAATTVASARSTIPPKGTEGPDIRAAQSPPTNPWVGNIEGPEAR